MNVKVSNCRCTNEVGWWRRSQPTSRNDWWPRPFQMHQMSRLFDNGCWLCQMRIIFLPASGFNPPIAPYIPQLNDGYRHWTLQHLILIHSVYVMFRRAGEYNAMYNVCSYIKSFLLTIEHVRLRVRWASQSNVKQAKKMLKPSAFKLVFLWSTIPACSFIIMKISVHTRSIFIHLYPLADARHLKVYDAYTSSFMKLIR